MQRFSPILCSTYSIITIQSFENCVYKITLQKFSSHLFCLCTQPLQTLSCTRSATWSFFVFTKIIWVSKTHDSLKDAVVTNSKFSINFCWNQSKCKLTTPLWRCLNFSKNKLNATPQVWKLINLCALTTNGLCAVFFENRERNVLKLDIAAVQFSSSCWRTGPNLMLIPVSACA